ncbi:MAG TPA: GNAT family N-acetyltransferase [Steroidobacteraceae bacterium]|jgi:aminoglycoside 6'-N-acetyltransferase|nr:GNAT family N-acetyltransferase [Steroidobacteraceae bacterium]
MSVASPMSQVAWRALGSCDFPLLQKWLSAPHVDAWWHQPLDLSGVAQKYRPRIEGSEPVHVFIIEHASQPIGWIQWYRWSDYPEHAAQLKAEAGAVGLDLAIGEVSAIGKGLGSRVIRQFALWLAATEADITAIVTDVEERNVRSCRAFEKAGFIPLGTLQLKTERVRRRVMHLSLRGAYLDCRT